MQVYLIFGLLFSLAVALFAVQNASRVDITILIWQLKAISLVVVILASALIGAAAAGLFGTVKQVQYMKKLRNLKAQIESQTLEIEYLKKKINEPNHNDEPVQSTSHEE